MLYEHSGIAFLLLGAFVLLVSVRRPAGSGGLRLEARTSRRGSWPGSPRSRTTSWPWSPSCSSPTSWRRCGACARGSPTGSDSSVPSSCSAPTTSPPSGLPFTTNYAFEDPQFLERGERLPGRLPAPGPVGRSSRSSSPPSAGSSSRPRPSCSAWPASSPGSGAAGCAPSGCSWCRSSGSSSRFSRRSTGGTAGGQRARATSCRPCRSSPCPRCSSSPGHPSSRRPSRPSRSRSTSSSWRWTRRHRWGSRRWPASRGSRPGVTAR